MPDVPAARRDVMSRLIAAFIFRWRYPLSALCVLGALVSIPSANITKIDNDITAWFSKSDPVYQDYERFRAEFGGTRNLIVALQASSPEALFSEATLAYIERITGDIERIDTVQRVESLATATVVDAVPDGLDVRRLIELAQSGGPDAVRRRAVEDELIRGDLVSEDATVTASIVSFDEDRIDAVRGGVIQQIHDAVDPGLPPGIRAFYNGSLEISETYNRITLDNQQKFTPPILFVTVAAIYFTFRSFRKTLLALFAVAISVLWTLGLYSLLGFSYNVLASMIVPLIVVLAIADDVHIMQHWDEERRHGDVEQAFTNTVAHLTAPLLGASATTALGMLSLATSDVVAVRSFGIGSAVGIMVDFVISLVLMPTLLSLVKPETGETPHERYLLPPLQRVAKWSTRHPGRVLTASVAGGPPSLPRHLPAPRRHEPHQLLQPQPPAGAVGSGHRQQAGGRLQLSADARGAARLAEASGHAGANEPAAGGAPARSLRSQGDVGRRLRQAHSPRAERRPE